LGAPRAQFFGVPRRVGAIFLLKLQLLALKIGGQAKKICSAPQGAFEHEAQKF